METAYECITASGVRPAIPPAPNVALSGAGTTPATGRGMVSVGTATAMMKRMRISPIALIVVIVKTLKGRMATVITGATMRTAILAITFNS